MPRLTKEEKEKQRLAAIKREEQLRKRKKVHDEIMAVIFIAIGLFLVFSIFTGTTGAVGAAIKAFFGGLLGPVVFALPFMMIVYGILVFADKTSFVTLRSVIAFVVFLIMTASLIANFKVPLKDAMPYDFGTMGIKSIYAMGTDGGGIIGVYVGGFIKNLIGVAGLYIVSAAVLIITLLMILNTPLSSWIDKARISAKARKEQRERYKEEQLELKILEEERKEELARVAAENKAKEEAEAAKAAAAAAKKMEAQKPVKEAEKPKEVHKEAPAKELPSLNIDAVRNMEETHVPEEKEPEVIEEPEEPEQIEIEEEPSVPVMVFKPEDIGLKSSEKPRLVVAGITENQQKVLDLVMDDDLFKSNTKPAEPVYAAEEEPEPAPSAPKTADEAASEALAFAVSASSKKAEPTPEAPAKETAQPAADEEVKYKFPPLDLLAAPSSFGKDAGKGGMSLSDQSKLLENTLESFGVTAKVIDVIKGPAVTRFEVQPATGVKVSKITALQNDLALNLRAKSLRIEAPIPGKSAVGIEVSNESISSVPLREVLESDNFKKSKSKISVGLGKSIGGDAIVADLKSMPHLLVAGATGSGKSVCINSMLISLLYKASPDEVKLILIDPKVVELSIYNGIPHLLIPVVTDPGKAAAALGWAVTEMNDRYAKFAAEGVRDLQGYNETVKANGEEDKVMPQIVIVIDELHDLMLSAKNSVEDSIARITAKARAAGMHLVVATQRPSTDVITGVIKGNIPSRIAFQVSSAIDSRVILDMGGAEHLLGKGDMLYGPQNLSKPMRVQGCYVSDGEVSKVIGFIKDQVKMANYNSDVLIAMNKAGSSASQNDEQSDEDELLTDAIETVVRAEQCSVSMLQRRFRIGYNRAARLVDLMEERGIVGPPDGARPRVVNLTIAEFERLQDEAAADEPVEEELF